MCRRQTDDNNSMIARISQPSLISPVNRQQKRYCWTTRWARRISVTNWNVSSTTQQHQQMTSGQSNLTQGCIAAADGRFNRICQVARCALPWGHTGAIWWIVLVNTIVLILPLAHPSPKPKRQIDWFGHFCTDHGRVSLSFSIGRPLPHLKLPRPMGEPDPHLTHDSLGPSEPTTQTASRSVRSFLHRWLYSVLHFTMGCPFPLKIAPSHGGIWTSI